MTSSVTIYHIPKEHISNELSTTSCCINIIDTPGFGDTRGPVWDEKIAKMIGKTLHLLTSLDYFLMAVKSTDNRLEGSSSNLAKSLKCLRMLGLVDKENPNVIGIT